VSNQEKTIGQMFGMVDELKKGFHIDNYSISQTTLEQIFQSFANLNFDA
jgi:ATP-binding cassette subfamily A (ABC1) protein 1